MDIPLWLAEALVVIAIGVVVASIVYQVVIHLNGE